MVNICMYLKIDTINKQTIQACNSGNMCSSIICQFGYKQFGFYAGYKKRKPYLVASLWGKKSIKLFLGPG